MATVKFHLTSNIVNRIDYIIDNHKQLGKDAIEKIEPLLYAQHHYKATFEKLRIENKNALIIDNDNDTLPTNNTDLKKPFSMLEIADRAAKSIESNEKDLKCQGFVTFTDMQTITELCKQLNYPTDIGNNLHNILQNTTMCYHNHKKSTYTAEFAAYLKLLKEKATKNEFESAMSNLPVYKDKAKQEDAGFISKNMEVLGTPINLLAVAGTCGFVAYFLARQIFTKPEQKMFHVIGLIIGALFGFILETTLFVIRDYRQQEQKSKQKKKEREESLQLMRMYYNEISNEQQQLQQVDIEYEKYKKSVLNNNNNSNNASATPSSSISIEQQQKEDNESKKDK